MLKNLENLITSPCFFYFCNMFKKFQIVLITVVSLFLMLHQSYAQYPVNTVSETGRCCYVSHKKGNCCEKPSSKTTSCKAKNCCSYTISASPAIMEPHLNFTIVTTAFSQQKISNTAPLFFTSPLYSIWQPPKIRLNL